MTEETKTSRRRLKPEEYEKLTQGQKVEIAADVAEDLLEVAYATPHPAIAIDALSISLAAVIGLKATSPNAAILLLAQVTENLILRTKQAVAKGESIRKEREAAPS